MLTTFSSLLPDLLEKTRTFGNPRPRETPWKPPLVVAPLTEVVHICARRIAMKVHVVSVRPRQGGLLVKKWISSPLEMGEINHFLAVFFLISVSVRFS